MAGLPPRAPQNPRFYMPPTTHFRHFQLPGTTTPQNPPVRASTHPHPRTWRCNKTKYHHGTLVRTAVRRGVEIVAERGPMGLTLRGLARDLGVTAAALNYYFANRAGLLAAVANAAAEHMRPYSVFRSGGARAGAKLRAQAEAWVEYAANNPNLYRIAFGEGWRGGACGTMVRGECVHSVDRVANIGQMSGHIRSGEPRDVGWTLFSAIHGLAHTLADGAVPLEKAKAIIDHFVSGLEAVPEPPRSKSGRSGGATTVHRMPGERRPPTRG